MSAREQRKPSLHLERCGPTRKVRFRSEGAATTALAERQRERIEELEARRREVRAYACDLCGGWHLTSKRRAKEA